MSNYYNILQRGFLCTGPIYAFPTQVHHTACPTMQQKSNCSFPADFLFSCLPFDTEGIVLMFDHNSAEKALYYCAFNFCHQTVAMAPACSTAAASMSNIEASCNGRQYQLAVLIASDQLRCQTQCNTNCTYSAP